MTLVVTYFLGNGLRAAIVAICRTCVCKMYFVTMYREIAFKGKPAIHDCIFCQENLGRSWQALFCSIKLSVKWSFCLALAVPISIWQSIKEKVATRMAGSGLGLGGCCSSQASQHRKALCAIAKELCDCLENEEHNAKDNRKGRRGAEKSLSWLLFPHQNPLPQTC